MYCSNGVAQEVLLQKNRTGSKAKAKVSILVTDYVNVHFIMFVLYFTRQSIL